MAKQKLKTVYICQSCGVSSPKWMGKCPQCGSWNSYVEEVVEAKSASGKQGDLQHKAGYASAGNSKDVPEAKVITAIESISTKRFVTPDAELNRVLGGGVVPGSVILLGGEPGIGKSTLLLQLAIRLPDIKLLYVAGEESGQQVKMRAERIGINNEQCFILSETDLLAVFKQAKKVQPEMVVVDSIQTLSSSLIESPAGSVSQIRECAAALQRYAKEQHIPVFIVGHITKEGNIAGPKILEHMVDTVLQFEGDRHHTYRLLRTKKNRFGSTQELGIYEMQANGLRTVSNPSELLISEANEGLSGIGIAATIEGLRPLLIETQALVSVSAYGVPQRSTTGYDQKRLNMLLAVLEKRLGLKFGDKDVFVNLAGGIRIEDPAIDLSIAAAIISSYEDVTVPSGVCFAGEIGLSGEVRSVNRIEQRIYEADKLGFKEMYMPKGNTKGLDYSKFGIKLKTLNHLHELFNLLFA